jgi:hypothetical protein
MPWNGQKLPLKTSCSTQPLVLGALVAQDSYDQKLLRECSLHSQHCIATTENGFRSELCKLAKDTETKYLLDRE